MKKTSRAYSFTYVLAGQKSLPDLCAYIFQYYHPQIIC